MILLQPVKLVMLVKPIGPYSAGSPFIFRFCKDRGEVASIKVAKPQTVACHNTTAFFIRKLLPTILCFSISNEALPSYRLILQLTPPSFVSRLLLRR